MLKPLVFFLLVLFSCANPSESVETDAQDSTATDTTASFGKLNPTLYFGASGSDPFWTVKISEDQIEFKSFLRGKQSFIAPHVEPVLAQDANVKTYRAETEAGKLTIEIRAGECTSQINGATFPYTVVVGIQMGKDPEFTMLPGCGQYVVSSRLHDIWALESMYGVPVKPEDFEKQVPYLEIRAAQNQFSGYAGCNQISGGLFNEHHLLRFTNPIVTMRACKEGNQEQQFLEALKATTHYKLQDMKLILSNPDGETLVLRKVD